MNKWRRIRETIWLSRAAKNAARFLLAAVIVVALLGSLPAPVQAQETEPIKLVLGGSGASSWSIKDIKPCASGTEEVTLQNVGYLDGFVIIWVSAIDSQEGLNPEPEIDTTGDGELDNYLLFNLSTNPADIIKTNTSLPATPITINNFPTSVGGTYYIYFPLNHEGADGDTVTLSWYWELPCGTGNDAQGDTLSFDINYTLVDELPTPTPTPTPGGGGGGGGGAECYLIVDMLGEKTTVEIGCCTNCAIGYYLAYDADKKHFLEIKNGMELICGECSGCYCYPKVIVMSLSTESPTLPDGMASITPIYDFTGYKDLERKLECKKATYFDPPLIMQISYDPALLPEGATNPVIAFYDDAQGVWKTLPPDTGRVAAVGIATGVTNYFASPFAVLVNVTTETTPQPPTPPAPAHFVVSDLNIASSVREIWQPVTFVTKTGENVTITANVANDGGQEGTYLVELKINGKTIDSQEVTLGTGQSEQVSFTLSGMEAGQYEVAVSGLSGEFTVLRTINWWLIGSIIAALILIGWLVWYRWFRRKKLRPEPAS
jgi:hypothetical protein